MAVWKGGGLDHLEGRGSLKVWAAKNSSLRSKSRPSLQRKSRLISKRRSPDLRKYCIARELTMEASLVSPSCMQMFVHKSCECNALDRQREQTCDITTGRCSSALFSQASKNISISVSVGNVGSVLVISFVKSECISILWFSLFIKWRQRVKLREILPCSHRYVSPHQW